MATVEIEIGGTDYAPSVAFARSWFESAVNGQVGQCKIVVRDDTASMAFETGAVVSLLVDSEPIWEGYLVSVGWTYAFEALNLDDAGPTRWWSLEGSDINILFQKRIIYTKADPAETLGKLYGPNTPDSDAIADLVSDYLDLSGDGLDLSTKVETVADINDDQEARAWEAGMAWGDGMASIAALPGGVYFLEPGRFLVYTDVNTANAPFALTDQPAGDDAGYREMKIVRDGSSLANDVLAWGMGYGSAVPVFVRDEDAASQAEHGVWQTGVIKTGVYKQATINRIAASIIDGSPANQRGAKDDRVSVSLVTYRAGFRPAQKVDFTSNVFGFNDVIPIRKMRVTFDSPDTPRYELTLSHEIDLPWGFFDPFRFNLPPLPPFPPFPPVPPIIPALFPIDIFDRPDSVFNYTGDGHFDITTWETPTRGAPDWRGEFFNFGGSPTSDPSVGFAVFGGQGHIDMTTPTKATVGAPIIQAYSYLPLPPSLDGDECRIEFDMECVDSTSPPTSAGLGVGRTDFFVGLGTHTGPASFGIIDYASVLRSRTFTSDNTSRFVGAEGSDVEVDADPLPGLPLTHVVIDRSVSRGTTQVTFGDYPTVEEPVDATTPDHLIAYIETTNQITLGWVSTLRVSSIYGYSVSGGSSMAAGSLISEEATRSSSFVYLTTYPAIFGFVLVWRNGVLQRPTTDYTFALPNEITFSTSVDADEVVQVMYLASAMVE